MKEVQLPPRAAALSESMRDLGYSLEAAVADIIDNSISAGASKVDIFSDVLRSGACLAIVDNGVGMNDAELVEAMRHGSRNPREKRSADDLGRFGLGLKTASFSQCTKLTVVSSKGKKRSAAVWDLQLVSDRDDWIICVLDEDEIASLPNIDKLHGDGTLVLWENLDRLCEGDADVVNEKLVNEKIREVAKHLSLVFHRYLNGEIRGKKLSILINYHELKAFDPFCTSNKATELLRQEVIRINGDEVVIQPYILPHHSKLSAKEKDFYNSRSDFLNNQGVYVYRNGRLMAWGDWFRLVPKGEATKLARVRIDFNNSMDECWTIDIKKSRAYPPHPVRQQIKKIIGKITASSTRVIKGKGKRLYDSVPKPVWIRIAGQGLIEYALDRKHPVINAVCAALEDSEVKKMEEVLSIIESSIPIETIYADYTVSPQEFENSKDVDTDEILGRLEDLWEILSVTQDGGESTFRDVVRSVRPFSDYPEIVDAFIGGKLNA
ncbi:ATP-binding protein [Desulfoluna sp.]|uniref:ATP-binding protein n=1 Tax=Desulfoluna sp. TaxID=2045199 RepID=UPI00262113D1|nr:ATP-binding protein [Desulfoluna sp.]